MDFCLRSRLSTQICSTTNWLPHIEPGLPVLKRSHALHLLHLIQASHSVFHDRHSFILCTIWTVSREGSCAMVVACSDKLTPRRSKEDRTRELKQRMGQW